MTFIVLSVYLYNMNKHERHIKKMVKFKKRLSNYRLTYEEGNFNAFRSSGKPCSCSICRPPKYDRNHPKFKSSPITVDYIHNRALF